MSHVTQRFTQVGISLPMFSGTVQLVSTIGANSKPQVVRSTGEDNSKFPTELRTAQCSMNIRVVLWSNDYNAVDKIGRVTHTLGRPPTIAVSPGAEIIYKNIDGVPLV